MQSKKLHTGLLLIFLIVLFLLNGPIVMSISGMWFGIPIVWWYMLAIGMGIGLTLRWIFAITKNDEDA